MKHFNLNSEIYVKLTEEGFKHWRQKANFYLNPLHQESLRYYQEQANPAGYVKFTTWEFMQYFGSEMRMGAVTLVDANVMFNDKDVK